MILKIEDKILLVLPCPQKKKQAVSLKSDIACFFNGNTALFYQWIYSFLFLRLLSMMRIIPHTTNKMNNNTATPMKSIFSIFLMFPQKGPRIFFFCPFYNHTTSPLCRSNRAPTTITLFFFTNSLFEILSAIISTLVSIQTPTSPSLFSTAGLI